MKIILERYEYGWGAWFYGVGRMPEDVEIPLPWSPQAYLQTVAKDLNNRFPHARVYCRENGQVTEVPRLQ